MTGDTNNQIGKLERATPNRVLQLFQKELGYDYLGDWEEEIRIILVEEDLLLNYLVNIKVYSETLANKAVEKFVRAAFNIGIGLYESNNEVYKLLRYSVNVLEELGEAKENVFLIDWENRTNNEFGVAEEVSFVGKHGKRTDHRS